MYGQFLKTIERTDTETQSAGRQFNFLGSGGFKIIFFPLNYYLQDTRL